MNVFADTSAFFAILDPRDLHHQKAAEIWRRLIENDTPVVTTNYVVAETFSVCQRRMGIGAARSFHEKIAPVLNIVWVDESIHEVGTQALLAAGSSKLSLVDCVSFHVMRQYGITAAFAFDKHFEDQGFDCNP